MVICTGANLSKTAEDGAVLNGGGVERTFVQSVDNFRTQKNARLDNGANVISSPEGMPKLFFSSLDFQKAGRGDRPKGPTPARLAPPNLTKYQLHQ